MPNANRGIFKTAFMFYSGEQRSDIIVSTQSPENSLSMTWHGEAGERSNGDTRTNCQQNEPSSLLGLRLWENFNSLSLFFFFSFVPLTFIWLWSAAASHWKRSAAFITFARDIWNVSSAFHRAIGGARWRRRRRRIHQICRRLQVLRSETVRGFEWSEHQSKLEIGDFILKPQCTPPLIFCKTKQKWHLLFL